MSALMAISIVVLALIGLSIAAMFLHVVVWLLGAILGLFIYFIPSIIAAARHHEHFLWVLVLNIVLGWSGIAWMILIVWAILGERREPPLCNLSGDTPNPPAH
ncbi:superinfection immunity protein [Acidithiobacillus sp.]|uniref:superinfection immunity protein n=1 Tax=Acidithiobacillus sp. TaxID=1872118 RepID=UPI0025B7C02F|nr:superinfection immunity protein [Acidithiobacillus sp.]MCK9188733.1 superinfection immunity protein [Acidithiobacillus sp.]MCK9359725.1 superinfection immunity protein [Acidithiobacillus sp.]